LLNRAEDELISEVLETIHYLEFDDSIEMIFQLYDCSNFLIRMKILEVIETIGSKGHIPILENYFKNSSYLEKTAISNSLVCLSPHYPYYHLSSEYGLIKIYS
jgi:hypothetical protein